MKEHLSIEIPAALEERLVGVALQASRGARAQNARVSYGHRFRWAAAALLLLAAGAGTALLWEKREPSVVWLGNSLRTENETRSVELADGTSIVVGPRTVLRASDSASRVHVDEGRAAFSVAHQPEGRRFEVITGDVVIVVLGTQFVVEREPDRRQTTVTVHEGVVEVRREEVIARLTAGQSWSEIDDDESLEAEAAAPGPESREPAVSPEARSERSERAVRRPRRGPRSPHATTVALLLAEASTAQRRGDARAAAHAYERFLHDFPRDSRASYAAFQLGRIRMDSLADARGAVRAFRRALHGARGSYREDALGRLALAYAASGELGSCRRVGERYATTYPEGVHLRAIERACGGTR